MMNSENPQRPIRIALLSSLYPNVQQPRHGIFVEERLRRLVDTGLVEARVIAPVPWFFSKHPRFGHYARLAAVPFRDERHGISIEHPRYIVVPKVGMTWGPVAMVRAVAPCLESLRADGFDFDLIDAHYFYPDGVAAARLAARFDRPVTITARGDDINRIANMAIPGRQIKRAAQQAGRMIAVSQALADRMERLGISAGKISTLRNGVDIERFSPRDRRESRLQLGVKGKVWLCVGHFIKRKGMHVALEALSRAPDVSLLLVGDGPEEDALRKQAESLGVDGQVRFEGAIPHDGLPLYYSAADVLMHAASSEGMPNVVLEALACGCAVIATPVGGIPEILTGLPAGMLMRSRDAAAMLHRWQQLQNSEVLNEAGRSARREYAQRLGWEPTTQGQLEIFARLTGVDPGIGDTGVSVLMGAGTGQGLAEARRGAGTNA